MLTFFNKYKLGVLGMIVGGILGFGYYYFIGCNSGSCAIFSKSFNSSAYGMVMGYLMFSVYDKSKNQKNDD